MELKNISVFFPAYNEEGNIASTVEKAKKVLEGLKINWEILVINDGSTDNTQQISEEISKKDKRIRVINKENGGYGTALRAGYENAKYEVIVYTDGDGQFDFAEVTKFIEQLDNLDLIIGYRLKRQDPFYRKVFAKGWRASLFMFFQLYLKDVDCGFKMVKKEVLEKIPPLKSTRGGMINAELAIKAKKYGFRVGQVGVNHYARLSGKPTGASIGVIIQSYLDLLQLWWSLK